MTLEVEGLRAALATAADGRAAAAAELAAALPLSDAVLELLSAAGEEAARAVRAGQDELERLERERNEWFEEAVSATLLKDRLEETVAGLSDALQSARRESVDSAARAEAAAASAAALPRPAHVAEATAELRAAQEGVAWLAEGLQAVARREAALEAALRDGAARIEAARADAAEAVRRAEAGRDEAWAQARKAGEELEGHCSRLAAALGVPESGKPAAADVWARLRELEAAAAARLAAHAGADGGAAAEARARAAEDALAAGEAERGRLLEELRAAAGAGAEADAQAALAAAAAAAVVAAFSKGDSSCRCSTPGICRTRSSSATACRCSICSTVRRPAAAVASRSTRSRRAPASARTAWARASASTGKAAPGC
jgi:SWI/SNF-related matrix-associated actin-dependent regulator 1 of chromatin subfamily A